MRFFLIYIFTLPFESLWVSKIFKRFWKKAIMLTKAAFIGSKNTETIFACDVQRTLYGL